MKAKQSVMMVRSALVLIVVLAGAVWWQSVLHPVALYGQPKPYVNPIITKEQDGVVMTGLSPKDAEPDYIAKSVETGMWHKQEPAEYEYSKILAVHDELAKIKSLRIGAKTSTGIRIIARTIPSSDADIFLVQTGIEEFSDPNGDYPFGVPFTTAEDYVCDRGKMTCARTSILQTADKHMVANNIPSRTGYAGYFWQYWDHKFNTLIGYRQGEGASAEQIYMYRVATNDHVSIDMSDTQNFSLSPSWGRLIVLRPGFVINTYDVKDDFLPVETASFATMQPFFSDPTYFPGEQVWSADESRVYLRNSEQIFVHDITTGVTDRLVDITSLRQVPGIRAAQSGKGELQSLGIVLSKSGQYAHYELSPYDQTQQNTVVILDLLHGNKVKEFKFDKEK